MKKIDLILLVSGLYLAFSACSKNETSVATSQDSLSITNISVQKCYAGDTVQIDIDANVRIDSIRFCFANLSVYPIKALDSSKFLLIVPDSVTCDSIYAVASGEISKKFPLLVKKIFDLSKISELDWDFGGAYADNIPNDGQASNISGTINRITKLIEVISGYHFGLYFDYDGNLQMAIGGLSYQSGSASNPISHSEGLSFNYLNIAPQIHQKTLNYYLQKDSLGSAYSNNSENGNSTHSCRYSDYIRVKIILQ